MSGYSCAEHRVEVPDRLAGELSALGQERFDRHQLACASCRAFLGSYAGALAAGRADVPPPSIGEADAGWSALAERLRAEAAAWPDGPQDGRQPDAGRRPFAAGRRWWPWALVAAGVAAAGMAAALTWMIGSGTSGAGGGEWVSVSPRPGLELRVASGTDIHFEAANAGTTTLVLGAGTVYARVAPLPPGEAFVVRTPDLAVRVVGTIFMVHSAPGEPSRVAAFRGAVAVERAGSATELLVAGEAWRAPGPATSTDERDLAPVRDWVAAASGAATAARAGGTATASAATGAATGAAGAATAPAAPAHVASAAALPPAAPAAPAALARAPAAAPSYAEAEAALAARGPAAAAALLERLVAARPDSSDADTARLELGRLYAGPLARPADARRNLEAFLARSPGGAGAAAARALLCRVDPRNAACTIVAPGGD